MEEDKQLPLCWLQWSVQGWIANSTQVTQIICFEWELPLRLQSRESWNSPLCLCHMGSLSKREKKIPQGEVEIEILQKFLGCWGPRSSCWWNSQSSPCSVYYSLDRLWFWLVTSNQRVLTGNKWKPILAEPSKYFRCVRALAVKPSLKRGVLVPC